MWKNRVLLFWCKKVAASCAPASENKDSYLTRRDCMGVCAAENSMLFILDVIISLTQIKGRGGQNDWGRWVHSSAAFL